MLDSNNHLIQLLNNQGELVLDHTGKMPEDFASDAHEKIVNIFKTGPAGNTPLYKKLKKSFERPENTALFVLTDGLPTDKSADETKDLVYLRHPGKVDQSIPEDPKLKSERTERSHRHPVTFMICTDSDEEKQWMCDSDDEAEFVSAIDDFKTRA